MVLNWPAALLNTNPVQMVPSAPTVYIWPTGYVIGVARVTQAGVIWTHAVGTVRTTQAGILIAQAILNVRVTQVGVIVIRRPGVCEGIVRGQRTDGLPYVPDVPDPCAGTGTRSGIRTGA